MRRVIGMVALLAGVASCRNCSAAPEILVESDAGPRPSLRPERLRDRDGGFLLRRPVHVWAPDGVAPAPSIE